MPKEIVAKDKSQEEGHAKKQKTIKKPTKSKKSKIQIYDPIKAAHFDISKEVKEAMKKNLPIVALESTIITHGMEYPTNRDTAMAVEQIVRENGAVPATIAIINGVVKIGLTA